MTTWGRGRELLLAEARVRSGVLPLKQYLQALLANPPVRVAGTAVFLTIDIDTVPHALVDNLEHNRVLHDRLVFVSVTSRTIPCVPPEQRVTVASLDNNCWSVVVAYGFKDDIDLPCALGACAAQGLLIDPAKVSYFLSHALVVAVPGKGMWLWRAKLVTAMSHNITNVGGYFKLPPNRAIELGSMIEI